MWASTSAKAGTHTPRRSLWTMLVDRFRAATAACGYGSLRSQGRRRSRGRHLILRVRIMAITLAASDVPRAPLSARFTTPQVWGIVLIAPYLLVFLAFVVYPVGYGLWLARHPASYVALYHDPI